MKRSKSIPFVNHINLKKTPLKEDFKMIKKLGEGLYGEVYLVENKATNKLWVLKCHKKEVMKEKFEEKFQSEFDVIKKIDHPHIYTVYAFYHDSENYYILSEYLKGGELFDFLAKRKTINEKEAY